MKRFIILLLMFALVSCTSAKERTSIHCLLYTKDCVEVPVTYTFTYEKKPIPFDTPEEIKYLMENLADTELNHVCSIITKETREFISHYSVYDFFEEINLNTLKQSLQNKVISSIQDSSLAINDLELTFL